MNEGPVLAWNWIAPWGRDPDASRTRACSVLPARSAPGGGRFTCASTDWSKAVKPTVRRSAPGAGSPSAPVHTRVGGDPPGGGTTARLVMPEAGSLKSLKAQPWASVSKPKRTTAAVSLTKATSLTVKLATQGVVTPSDGAVKFQEM